MPFFRSLRFNSESTQQSRRPRLSVTQLEEREVPAASLLGIGNTDFASTKPLFVPVAGTSSVNQPITYAVSSGNQSIAANVVVGGRTLRLDVSGRDSTGQDFTGTLTFRLFEDIAPLATGRIIQLANQGFYNGLTFHRIIDNFVIQGGDPNGDGTGGSTLGTFPDEFNPDYTFTSNGLLALANSGDDTNNSQFFVTDIDRTLSQRPEHLNFNHTIFGILTSGFDTFQKIITTPTGTGDRPVTPVIINQATIINDSSNGVLRIQSQAGFTGSTVITVSGTDGDGAAAVRSFTVTSVQDNVNDRAFLNPVANPSVVQGSSTSFTLSAFDREGDMLTYRIGTPGNLAQAPANVTVSLDQSTGAVTLTPAAGFTGTIPLLVGVRDQTRRAQTPLGTLADLDDAGNFDTQVITLTVRTPTQAAITLTASPLTVGVKQSVLLTATVTGDEAAGGGTVVFTDAANVTLGQANVQNGSAVLTTQFSSEGSQQITARFTATTGGATATSNTVNVTVNATSPPTVTGITARSVTAGSAPRVTVLNPDGSVLRTIQAFEDSFLGGVRVALADVTGDGNQELVTVPGNGGAPIIRIFNPFTGALVRETMIFEDTFRGGLNLAVADSFRLGYSQILVGAGNTGGPRVTLFDASRNLVLLNYFAYDSNLRGGVSVAFGDLRGDSIQQIITGAGPGGGPVVKVFDGLVTSNPAPSTLGSFLAGQESNRDGIRVGVGDIPTGGTRKPILVGPAIPEDSVFTQSFDPVGAGIDLD